MSSQSDDDNDDVRSPLSPRMLAHVLARKERDSQQLHQLLKLTLAKLDDQSRRATDAERRATECLVRARAATDARAQSDADAAASRTELALYKMQLEQAQREINRAQEYLDGLEARRHDAEQDAARARSVARKLQEERAVEAAREQGKQQGFNEGLRQGILLGRRESDNHQPRSRRRQEEHNRRPSSRSRRPADVHFTQVNPESPHQSPSERSPPDDLHRRVLPGPSPELPRNRTPVERPYDTPSPSLSPSPPQRSRSRSQSRPRLETPAPEPARSRPYTPHDDSTPSIIQPIPIPASASPIGPLQLHPSPSPSPVRHPLVRIPPDNWIPRAQDTAGDGRLSIYLPPPHELIESILPDGPFAIAPTPEEGSPAVVPPPPILSPSPAPRNRRSPEFSYGTPPPPDLGPAVPNSRAPRSRDVRYAATPPPPDLGPAVSPRARDNPTTQPPLPTPPPPDLAPVSSEPAFVPPQQIATNYSRASTHLSEFDILAPVGQPPRKPSNIGPPPAEEDELEYVDPPMERIPRQPIAPDPPLQHRQPQMRPFRGPPRPRNIVFPAPLSQAPAQPAVPQPPYMQQQPPPPRAHVQDEDEEDAPVHVTAKSNRPQRSHTQSSIGISVQPPSPDDSPPSSGNEAQRRLDLLSPEYAERSLPMSIMDTFFSRNKQKPKPPIPQEEQQQSLPPLPELADLAPDFAGAPPSAMVTNAGRESRSRRHARSRNSAPKHANVYEAAPLPAGIDYPASPLQRNASRVTRDLPAPPVPVPIPVPMAMSEMMMMRDGQPLSNDIVPPSSGFLGLGLKGRLPWRRNTTAAK